VDLRYQRGHNEAGIGILRVHQILRLPAVRDGAIGKRIVQLLKPKWLRMRTGIAIVAPNIAVVIPDAPKARSGPIYTDIT
jgi:hypothetical protein